MTNIVKKSLLIYVKDAPPSKTGKKMAYYKCECGSIKVYFVCNVKSLHTLSCGCKPKDTSSYKKHGLIKHPLYWIWSGIIQRCTNPNNPIYKYYGGNGITICEEWRNDFYAFYNWCIENGWKPGLDVDKDTKGGKTYSPDNCVIITKKDNSNRRKTNKFIEYKNEVKTLQQWSDDFGINSGDLRYRLRINNWDMDKALSYVPRIQRKKINKNA